MSNHNLYMYIGVIIFPHIDNLQSTGLQLTLEKIDKKETQKSEGLTGGKADFTHQIWA